MNKGTISIIAISIALGIATFSAFNSIEAPQTPLDVSTVQKFNLWAVKYGKTYFSPKERAYRTRVFAETLKLVETINSDPTKSYKLGLNKFADMSHQEVLIKYTGRKPLTGKIPYAKEEEKPLTKPPIEKNWVKLGKVTKVKDQQDCGSCYAFSACGAIESYLLIKHNLRTDLSEQQIVDCSTSYGNNGCDGGLEEDTLAYANAKGGITTESVYPYRAKKGKCRFKSNTAIPTKFKYKLINPGKDGESKLVKLLVKYPVSVGIAVNRQFDLYKSGIFNGNCPSRPSGINHAVVAVGYGVDRSSGKKYFIIKNSWGRGWGEVGYMRLRRGVKRQYGVCAVAAEVLDAEVTKYK